VQTEQQHVIGAVAWSVEFTVPDRPGRTPDSDVLRAVTFDAWVVAARAWLLAGRALAMAGRTCCLSPVIRGIDASCRSKSVHSTVLKYKPAFEGAPFNSISGLP
jgi:hypothetical protein